MMEIGSEFWQPYSPASTVSADCEMNLLSGRTALRLIIDDARKIRGVRTAMLPSYCCESMIQPFLQAGMDVQFYPVLRDHVEYPYDNNADVVLLIDFFGYTVPQNAEIASAARQAGKTVIYDGTHKIDGNPAVKAFTDYSFCSFRKWFYCNCAKAVRHNGEFADLPKLSRHERYEALRDEAAREKEAYIAGRTDRKEGFLEKFHAAEEMLERDYMGYAGTPVIPDLRNILAKRRENAAYLIQELKQIPKIVLWRDSLDSADTPLFVPVLVDSFVRAELRSALIQEKIYCPIHWPKSPYHSDCNDLYDMELSLICDQRYSLTDMARMVSVIQKFFNR